MVGARRPSSQDEASTSLPSSSPHSEQIRDADPSATLLNTATMGSPSGRLYNPYEGLSQVVGAKPHAFKLPEGPEFVFEEEASVRRRGWTENLQFYTGLGYLAGGTTGVTAGVYQYLRHKPELANESLKLKTNRLLNFSGSYARPFGNSCGILGLYFSSLESYFNATFEKHGVPDTVSTVLAGFAAGGIFRTPRGPRQAVIAGAVGAVAASGIVGLRTMFPSL